MTSDEFQDSDSKLPCIGLWNKRRILPSIKSHLGPSSAHPSIIILLSKRLIFLGNTFLSINLRHAVMYFPFNPFKKIFGKLLYLSQWQETWHWFDSEVPPFSEVLLQVGLPSWLLLDEAADCVKWWWRKTQLLPQGNQAVSQEPGCRQIWRWKANLALNLKRKFCYNQQLQHTDHSALKFAKSKVENPVSCKW